MLSQCPSNKVSYGNLILAMCRKSRVMIMLSRLAGYDLVAREFHRVAVNILYLAFSVCKEEPIK